MTTNVERARAMLALADAMRVDELIEYFAEDAVMIGRVLIGAGPAAGAIKRQIGQPRNAAVD